jgi:hypothetical protein
MTTEFRKLCAELVAWADKTSAHYYQLPELLIRARAALAESDGPAVQSREPASVTAEPSDRELLELMPETMQDEFSYAAKTCSDATGGQVKPRIFRVCLNTAALEYAHAVLARWGNHPATSDSSLQPIPVSERLPEAEDCDEEGRCWAGTKAMMDTSGDRDVDLPPSWELREVCPQDDGWLPAHALPLPKEVE